MLGLVLAVVVAAPPVEAPKAVAAIHRSVHSVQHNQRLLAMPVRGYHRGAEARGCRAGCEWSLAIIWHRIDRLWQRHRRGFTHPSTAKCWRLLERVFAPYGQAGMAAMIVERESHCWWAAQNPSSTASGVMQFLDSWGSLSQRLDAVWSINRAEAYWRVERDWHPWGF